MGNRTQSARLFGLALAGACLAACATTQAPPAPAGASLELPAGGTRADLRFPCGDAQCAGWLYLPSSSEARPPVVVMAHGFAGTRDVVLDDIAVDFAAAGLAAFVFDYRYFGDSGGGPRQLVDPWVQLEDWRAAIEHVRAHPAVDGRRVALWSSSQGAGHALILAAERDDLAAVVGQVPLVDADTHGEAGELDALGAARMVGLAWADLLRGGLLGAPVSLPAIGATGSNAYLADDAALDVATRLAAEAPTYRNEVLARSIVTYDHYNPADTLGELRCPVLLIASREDRFVPFSAVEAAAARAPLIEVVEVDGDHFDIYLSPRREVATKAAVEFFRRTLGAPPSEGARVNAGRASPATTGPAE